MERVIDSSSWAQCQELDCQRELSLTIGPDTQLKPLEYPIAKKFKGPRFVALGNAPAATFNARFGLFVPERVDWIES